MTNVARNRGYNEPLRLRLTRRIRSYFRMKTLGRYGIGYLVETPQGVFAVDPEDWWITRALLKQGSSALQAIRFLSRLIGKDSLVCFIGAHIGTLVVPLAARAGRVVAYEADPSNFRYLGYNLQLNGISNATIHNLAVGDRDGAEVTIRHDRSNTGHSSIEFGSSRDGRQVPMVTLGQHLLNDAGIDLVIMDIEGAEVHALRGMSEIMPRIRYLHTEFCPQYLAELGECHDSFIEALAPHWSHMYVCGNTKVALASGSWVEKLRNMPSRKNLLLKLLFTNEYLAPELLR